MTVPSGWRRFTPLEIAGGDKSRLIIGPFGSNLKTSDYLPKGVPLVFVRDIRARDFRRPRKFVSTEKAEELRSHITLPGDVLITKMGEPPGDTAVYSGHGQAIITADCIRLRPTDDFDARFIAYAIQAPAVQRQIERITSGVAQRKVSLSRFRTGLSIPAPSLDEQRRIVGIFEDHLSRLDAATAHVAVNLRRVEAWYSRLVTQELWRNDYPRLDVGRLLREPMRNGRSDRAARGSETGTRCLTLTAVTRNRFAEEHTKLTVTTAERAAGLWLEPGDVFVQRSNTPELVGTAARYEGTHGWAIFPDLLIRLRADESKIDSRYLVAALRSAEGHSQMRRKAKGLAGSMPKIDQATIANTVLPVPSLPEQERVLIQLEKAADALMNLRLELDRVQKRSTTLRQALMAAAFSGRLPSRESHMSDLDWAEEMITA